MAELRAVGGQFVVIPLAGMNYFAQFSCIAKSFNCFLALFVNSYALPTCASMPRPRSS